LHLSTLCASQSQVADTHGIWLLRATVTGVMLKVTGLFMRSDYHG